MAWNADAVLATSEMTVRWSDKRVDCDKTKELCPNFYSIWKRVYPSFWTRRMVGRGRPLLPKILCQTDPVRAKTPIFNR